MSRLQRVVATDPAGRVVATDLSGVTHALSTLAYDGPPLGPGDWVVAHSGFVLCTAAADDVEAATAEWERALEAGAPPANRPAEETS